MFAYAEFQDASIRTRARERRIDAAPRATAVAPACQRDLNSYTPRTSHVQIQIWLAFIYIYVYSIRPWHFLYVYSIWAGLI